MTTSRRLIALLSSLFLVPLIAVATATNTASAADDAAMFKPIGGLDLGKGQDVRVRPSDYRAYRVDLEGLHAQLGTGSEAQIAIPDPAGTMTTFTVVEHSVMEPELQAAHPEIRTYSGADADGSSISLDVTPMGFHAFVRRPDGITWLVDPAYNRRGENRVLSYAGGSTVASHSFVEKELQETVDSLASAATDGDFSTPGGPVSTRTYRMAFVTDPTYATYFGTGNVFAEKSTMMARVNEVYNDDLAIQFLLVAGTDTKLNLDTPAKMTGANGPCGASACYTAANVDNCAGDTLTRNVFVLGQIIGADNFDIGHIGLGNAGGGIAGLGVIGDSNKARGCTGLPTPDGDLYAIDYVAHEVGHQMGGNHTFNSSVCAANRNGSTSVEPGSGTSIMAYAGICGADNLQPHSDPYFSQRSVDEITNTTAAAPASFNERQSVAFSGLDVGEQIVLSCAACGSQTVTWTGSSATDSAALIAAINTVTGALPTLTEYDGASATIDADGFTANWTGSTNIKTLTAVANAGSTFDSIVGTIIQGGPETNQGVVAVSGNSSPVVTAPSLGNKSIPARTPFELTGSATDPNSDTLTYMWEQNNIGTTSESLPSNDKTAGPLFRQFGIAAPVSATGTLEYHSPGENLAGTSPTRTFPDLAQILAGNTNAATGSCPVSPPAGQTTVDCFSEFLPTDGYVGAPATRAMNFRLTARDEFTPDGAPDDPGGLSTADVVVTVVKGTGPFQVTSRATAGSSTSGAENVTWDVNGTNTAALAENVKISLSTDGGLTYPTVLSATTPNDGSQVVTLPNLNTTTARIKVEAVGNYFFDINDANFTIKPAAPPSAIKAKAEPKKITEGHKFKVKATVTTASGVPTGTVQVYKGSKLLGTGTLKSNGKVTIKISAKKAKKLKVGKNTLTAKYLGSATVAASQVDFKIKVVKKK